MIMISYIFTKSASIVPDAKTRHFLRHRLLLLNSFYDFREEKRRDGKILFTGRQRAFPNLASSQLLKLSY